MNVQDISEFAQDLQADESLQRKLSEAETIQETVRIANERGYELSEKDIKDKYKKQEMKENSTSIGKDLVENVAGEEYLSANGCPCNSCLSVYVTS